MDVSTPQGQAMWTGRPRLVLASSSPRRRTLLESLGALAEVRAPDAQESSSPERKPIEEAVALSRAKAESVAKGLTSGIVLGADTMVVLDGRALGKPRTPDEAEEMLRMLSGRTHLVVTGITLVEAGTGRSISAHAETEVTFRSLTAPEVHAYVATGEPMDKAGAYGAQGLGGMFIESVRGCFYNVVGLPLALLVKTLDRFQAAAGREGSP